jgi:hypothetical protein
MLVLSAATIVFGLGEAFRTGTHKAMIFDYIRKKGWADEKVHYYGHTRSWSQAGSAVSALLAAALVFYTGSYTGVFLYSAIPYLLGLILMLNYPAWLDGKAVSLRTVNIRKTTLDTLLGFWRSLRHPGTLRGILNVSSHGGYYRAVKDYLQPVIQSLALSLPLFMNLEKEKKSALLIGIIYFIIYFLSSATTRRSGSFTGRFGSLATPLNLTLIAGFSAGILSGLFYRMDLFTVSVVFFVLVYMLENLRLPAGISWFTENIEPGILATALSTESQGKSLFTAVLALGMGLLADRAGPGTALMLVSVLMLMLVPALRIGRGE